MKYFPPNINPVNFVTSANTVGYILATSNFTDEELVALAEWLFQVGQYLSTYIAQKQLLESRKEKEENNNSSLIIDN